MSALKSLSPCELIVLATVIAFAVCEGQNADDLNVLGNFIVGLGGLILTWAAQQQYLETACSQSTDTMSLDDMKKQIKSLQEKLDSMQTSNAL